jgi:hypothetical protein
MEGHYEELGPILNEAYYGGNPQLVKCEELFAKALESKSGRHEIKEIQNILQKLFNFKKLVISTIPLSLGATIPITVYKFKFIKEGIKLERTKTGVAFKTEDEVEAAMFLDLNMIKLFNITPREAIAIILHEIGHSMQMILPSEQLGNAIGAMNFVTKIFPMLLLNMSKTKDGKTYADAYEDMDTLYNDLKDRFVKYERDVQIQVKKSIFVVLSLGNTAMALKRLWDAFKGDVVKNIVKSVFSGIDTKIKMGLGVLRLPASYKAELFADHFATIYGYGQDLTSGLGKVVNTVNGSILNNVLFRLAKLPYNIIGRVLDPHPNDLTRFKSIITTLETELQKDINEDMYEIIKKDIDAAKQNLDDFITEMNKHKFRNADIIVFKKIMGLLMDGNDDVKHLFFNLKPEEIEYLDTLEK